MRRSTPIAEGLHIAALGVWLGAILVSGAAAAIIFPAMKSLDPRLPGYGAYGGPHWMIAGGTVANRIFGFADVIQCVCAALAVATLGWIALRGAPRGPVLSIRLLLAAGLLGVLGYRLGVLGPRMAADLSAFWTAAKAGDEGQAEVHRAAFDAGHPIAGRMIVTSAVLVLGALCAAVSSLARSFREDR